MYLARIEGTLTATVKHEALEGCCFLLGRRLNAEGQPAGDPLIIVDWLGAGRGETVVVTTDGDLLRRRQGNTTPARLAVVGIVDAA